MRLRIAIATLTLLGVCSVFSMKIPASEIDDRTQILFEGGGGPTPCPPPKSCPITQTPTAPQGPATGGITPLFFSGGGGPTPCPPQTVCPKSPISPQSPTTGGITPVLFEGGGAPTPCPPKTACPKSPISPQGPPTGTTGSLKAIQ